MQNQPYPQEIPAAAAFVTYQPLDGEADFSRALSLPPEKVAYVIRPRADLDPVAEVQAAIEAVGGRICAVLIPGIRFDASGTRHGRGGGWYDRFLAEAPEAWLRIGFCSRVQFSEEPLVREPWDQPVDFIYVDDGTWIRTGARPC